MIISPETAKPGQFRIFLDDEEITKVCFYAEAADIPGVEVLGMVRMYELDKSGVPYKIISKIGLVRWEPILRL